MQYLIRFIFSLRSLTRHPLQSLFAIVSIMVGVSLVVSIDSATKNANESFRSSAHALSSSATHRIISNSLGVHDSVFYEIRMTLPTLALTPVCDGYIALRKKYVTSQSARQHTGHLLGIDALTYGRIRTNSYDHDYSTKDLRTEHTHHSSAEANFSLVQLLPPQLFERFLRGDGMIITRGLADDLDIQTVQDSLTVFLDGIATHHALLAILDNSPTIPRDLVLCDISRAQEIYYHRDSAPYPVVHRLEFACTNPVLLDSLKRILPKNLSVVAEQSSDNSLSTMSSAFEMNLHALSMLALIVSMFITYNTVSFSALQRRKEFGIMRILGVDGRGIAWLLLRETLIISTIASLLGCLLGSIIAETMTAIVSGTINDLYKSIGVTAHLQWRSIAKGCTIGITTSCCAILPIAWECAHMPPRTIVQHSTDMSTHRSLLIMSVAGLCIFLSAWVLLASITHIVAGFVAILLLIVGSALLLPLIITLIVSSVTRIPLVKHSLWVMIALRGIRLSLQRFSIAITALTVAVSTVIAVTIMILSFRETVNHWLIQTLDADIYISPPSLVARTATGMVKNQLMTALIQQTGVHTYNTFRSRSITLPHTHQDRMAQLVSLHLSPDSYQRYRFKEAVPNPWKEWHNAHTVFLSEPLAHKTGLHTGDTLLLPTADSMRVFRIAGIIYDYASDVGVIYINSRHYQVWWQDSTISGVSLKCSPDSIATLLQSSRTLAQKYGQELLIRSNTALRTTSLQVFDSTFRITDALRLLTLFVACMSIFSTLLAIQLERSHEHAVIRALGMDARGVGKNVLLQTTCAGIIAGLCSLPLGYAMAHILTEYINVQSFGWSLELQVDILSILGTLCITIIMAVGAGLYPAYHAASTAIATTLHEE